MSMLSVGAHYDEETLIRVAEAAVEIEDPHLTACDDCRIAVDEYRDMLSCMSDEVIWDQRPIDDTPNPQTIATLRAFVEDMHREDAEAEPLVAELLAGSREEWMPRLMSDGKYRTAGVVRKLIARTDRLAQESAADYAVVAHLSVEISESLDSTGHALALRGAAWRELGFARYLGGDIDSAAEAEQRARACFEAGDSSPFDLARLDLLQATIQLRCEQTEAALQRLSAAAVIFDAFGARKRLADTIWLRANVFSERKAFETAFAVADEIRTDFDDVLDDHARASVLTNQGYYLREVGEYDRSLKYLREAQFILETIGARTTAVRVAVNIAAVLHVAGQLDAAAERLEACVNDARALGLPSLATLATLQLAEVRSEQQRYDDVERLCREAIEQVGTSAVAYRERALLALALLREVAQQRRASATVIRHVRRYVARLPQEPNLVFAPAPLRAGEDIFG